MNKNTSSSIILVHHGIKGQKWGVRRFQNPDGTLTPEGRDRYDEYQGPERSSGGIKEFARKHKKALIVGGTIVAAIAISKGIKYANNRRDDRIDEIINTYEKSWNQNARSNKRMAKKNGVDWKDMVTTHNESIAQTINNLYSMRYSDLAMEAKRVNYMFKHGD